jgi:hypothetical protein
MPTLTCRKTTFYSPLDEAMFFGALRKIASVRKVEGRGEDLVLTVASRLSDKSLRELLGLFLRYKVEMRQLAQFLTEKNRVWFRSPNAYWFKKVFPPR